MVVKLPNSRLYMRYFFAVLFHLLPLLPLLLGYYYVFIGGLLFVLLPYIKVRKLELLIELQEKNSAPEVEITRSRAALERMRFLVPWYN